MLDLIYGHPDADHLFDGLAELPRDISKWCLGTQACAAVRERRDILAALIDETAVKADAEIFSLACGHLREAELSEAVRTGAIKRFVAGDQDERSLAVVARNAGRLSSLIEPRVVSVRDILGARTGLGHFDLIYAAGLYDYLDDNLCAALTLRLFNMLKPGGRLLVGNYLHGIWEIPYMETYMDWRLIHRSQAQIEAFSSRIDTPLIARSTYWPDKSGCVGYLDIERA